MKLFKKIKAVLQYTKAVNAAESAHAKDGDMYYVLPGINKQLLVTNKAYFKMLKKKGYIAKNRTMKDVQLGCFYRTAGMHSAFLSKEEAAFRKKKFFRWYLR